MNSRIELIIEKVNHDDEFIVTNKYSGTDGETGRHFTEIERQTCGCCEIMHDCSCAVAQLLAVVHDWASCGESYGKTLRYSKNVLHALDKEECCIVDHEHLPCDWDCEKPYKLARDYRPERTSGQNSSR